MTGFGRSTREVEGLALEVELRSVNHRHLDLRLRLPRALADREATLKSLHRMEFDISLWAPSFFHLNEFGFVQSMTTLFDVLSTVPGTKAVVLYSAMTDVPLDLQFRQIAAHAAASRCAIYPVDAVGMRTIQQDIGVRVAQASSQPGGG